MIASMAHEPSYVAGSFSAPEIGVHVAWLTHPNSFAFRESGAHEGGALGVAFAGECFDVPAECRGRYIVRNYMDRGEAFISSLNGLFSGVVVDRRRGRSIIFNDRYSSERIYYHKNKDALYFASEIKALLRVLPELRKFDNEGVAQHLAYGCTMADKTLFHGVSRLPGATCWLWDRDGRDRRTPYFSTADFESLGPLSPRQFSTQFNETFTKVLPKYGDSDEPLGISLTGGLDTRMIMACLEPAASRQVCYTFAGSSDNLLDSRIAAKVAQRLGLGHHIIRIGKPFLDRFSEHLDSTVTVTDGNAGTLGAHEIYLNRQARNLAGIRLTGNFGSEVLRSASTFKPLGLDSSLFEPEWQRRIGDQETRADPKRGIHPTTFSAFREVPWNLFGTLAACRSQVTFRTPYLDNELVALAYRTPDALRGSAAPALDLIRSRNPSLGAIPTDRGRTLDEGGIKHVARRVSSELSFKLDYMHKEGLPSSLAHFSFVLSALDRIGLLGQHKFLAYRLWFQNELRTHVADVLNSSGTFGMPFWNRPFLERMLQAHVRGTRNFVQEIGTVLTFESIQRNLLSIACPNNERKDPVIPRFTGANGPAYV